MYMDIHEHMKKEIYIYIEREFKHTLANRMK